MVERVLVIDDDPVFCEIVRAYFAREGIEDIYVSHNARDALNLLEQQPNQIDLIVLDLNIPDFDGIELLQALRDLPYRGAISIVSAETPLIIGGAKTLGTQYGLNIIDATKKPLNGSDVKRWVAAAGSRASPTTE